MFYYSVLYRKISTKKNKTWDGDGILSVVPSAFTSNLILFDENGKQLANCKLKCDGQLDCGFILTIGSKQVEIVNVVESELFQSGQCFVSNISNTTTTSTATATISQKPYKSLNNANTLAVKGNIKSRHDALAIGAFVLPQPPKSHQIRFNIKNRPLIPVVVDPILSKHLRPHQKDGIAFLYECIMGYKQFDGTGCILADEMGLGKTVQAISLIWTVLKQTPYFGDVAPVKRVIIACPATLTMHWKNEFKKWLGEERIKTFVIDASKENKEQLRDFQLGVRIYPVLIISYERIRACINNLKGVFDLLVCDEGHRLKDANIQTTQALNKLGCKKRLILSGTPIQNDLGEFYAMVNFVNPGILGCPATFKRVYEDPILKCRLPNCSSVVKDLGDARQKELARLTSLFILRRSSSLNKTYLPSKTEIVLFSRPSELQKMLYENVLDVPCISALRSTYKHSTESSTGSHFSVIHGLRKLVNACELVSNKTKETEKEVYNVVERVLTKQADYFKHLYSIEKENINGGNGAEDENKKIVFELEASSKLSTLHSIIDAVICQDTNDKIVIVSNFTQTLDIIELSLNKKQLNFFRLDGSTVSHKRSEYIDRFNKNENSPRTFPLHLSEFLKIGIFLLSTKSGGVGLSLVGANRLVLYDPDWNPAHDAQAMARIWRDGQLKKVYIYRLLVSGTIDEKIYQRGLCKMALSQNVIDETGDSLDQFTPSDLKKLFEFHDTACLTHDLIRCSCQLSEKEGDDGRDEADKCRGKTSKRMKIEESPLEKSLHENQELIDKWIHFPYNTLQAIPESNDPIFSFIKFDFAFIKKEEEKILASETNTNSL